MKQQLQVEEFHEAISKKGRHLRLIPKLVGMWDIEDRRALIREEFDELMLAMDEGDMAEAVDGIMDLMYVLLGTLLRWKVPCEPFFDEVHRTNMAKVDGGSFNNVRKFIKPEGWLPPRIGDMLLALGVKRLTGWAGNDVEG